LKLGRAAILCGLLLIAMIISGSAYYYEFADYNPDGVVQLYFDGDEAEHLAGIFGSHEAAKMLVSFARDYGRTVTRSHFEIQTEIQAHAAGWIVGEHSHSNPMDISIN
jgi:hypothetical protein